jgi:hypothetical protein
MDSRDHRIGTATLFVDSSVMQYNETLLVSHIEKLNEFHFITSVRAVE